MGRVELFLCISLNMCRWVVKGGLIFYFLIVWDERFEEFFVKS